MFSSGNAGIRLRKKTFEQADNFYGLTHSVAAIMKAKATKKATKEKVTSFARLPMIYPRVVIDLRPFSAQPTYLGQL